MFFETEIGTPIVCVMIFFYRESDRGTEVILKDRVRVAIGDQVILLKNGVRYIGRKGPDTWKPFIGE